MTPGGAPPRPQSSRATGLPRLLSGGFDWIDAVSLVPMGILISLLGGHAPTWFGSFIFAPMIARRAIFGAPRRVLTKTGVVWSAAGVVGLLSILIGTGLVALSAWAYGQKMREPEPDWEATIRAHPPELVVVPVVPGESSEESSRRLEAAKREYVERAVATGVPERHAEWLKDRAQTTWRVLLSAGLGALLVALGALVDAIRYRRPPKSAIQ